MTYKTNRYGTYEIDHTTFGGLIYPSDFNTDYRGKDNNNGSQIASRIAKDKQADKQWRKYREGIERNKNYGK